MPAERTIESTLSFEFEDRDYESAYEYPILYRSLNLQPRSAHPFWIYEAIYRQGELVGETLKSAPVFAAKVADEFISRGLKRILLTGIGASYHLAASAAQIFQSTAGIPTEFVESSEAIFTNAIYDYPSTLVIALSASGNTVQAVDHVRMARNHGAMTAGLVNLNQTRIVGESEIAFTAAGGYGLVWDYSTRLIALVALAVELARRLGRSKQGLEALEQGLAGIHENIDRALQQIDAHCRKIGEEMVEQRAAVIPASGNLLPPAWEMALRFEEIAHFPAKGRPVVDFLHGGVGFLAKDITMIILAAPGPAYEYSKRLARVAQIVKSPAIGIVEEQDSGVSILVDEVIRLPAVHPILRPFMFLLPASLIPYYTEVARPGGNPDVQNTDKTRYARAFDAAYPPKSH